MPVSACAGTCVSAAVRLHLPHPVFSHVSGEVRRCMPSLFMSFDRILSLTEIGPLWTGARLTDNLDWTRHATPPVFLFVPPCRCGRLRTTGARGSWTLTRLLRPWNSCRWLRWVHSGQRLSAECACLRAGWLGWACLEVLQRSRCVASHGSSGGRGIAHAERRYGAVVRCQHGTALLPAAAHGGGVDGHVR